MNDKLKEIREKLDKHVRKMALGVAIATTLVSCGEKKDNAFTFDVQKDFAAAVIKNNNINEFQIPANTFQLDSLSAVEKIEGCISSKLVNKEDKRDVAATIYSNINAIEKAAEGLERPSLDVNDPILKGTKGYGYTTSGYANPKFNNVETEVQTEISGKKDTYQVSVETPNGYSGVYGYNLRSKRVGHVMAQNHSKDQSWAGVYR